MKTLLLALTLVSSFAWARDTRCEVSLRGAKQSLQLQATRKAGLHLSQPDDFTYTRLKRGRGFVFLDSRGKTLTQPKLLARFQSLRIPPNWQDVRITNDPLDHLQAFGTDARGRQQYLYHPQWLKVRDQLKFTRMLQFGHALPAIREAVTLDMRRKNLDRAKVLATIVSLLENTLIRVGNENSVEQNRTYGLTTLKKSHVRVSGSQILFNFVGKSHVRHRIRYQDAKTSSNLREMLGLPGSALFQYPDENGDLRQPTALDVNEYLRQISGEDLTAKDFRTWQGTVAAAEFLYGAERPDTQTGLKRLFKDTAKYVASRLENTPAVSRGSYIDPLIFKSYQNGNEFEKAFQKAERRLNGEHSLGELAVLILLEGKR